MDDDGWVEARAGTQQIVISDFGGLVERFLPVDAALVRVEIDLTAGHVLARARRNDRLYGVIWSRTAGWSIEKFDVRAPDWVDS